MTDVDEIARSALVHLAAQVVRSTSCAPSDMSMIEIDREFTRMRDAAHKAVAALKAQEQPR